MLDFILFYYIYKFCEINYLSLSLYKIDVWLGSGGVLDMCLCFGCGGVGGVGGEWVGGLDGVGSGGVLLCCVRCESGLSV